MSDKLETQTERYVKQLRGSGQADIADHIETLYAYRAVGVALQARVAELEKRKNAVLLDLSALHKSLGKLEERSLYWMGGYQLVCFQLVVGSISVGRQSITLRLK